MLNLTRAPKWAKGSGLVRDNVADGVGGSDSFGTKLPTTAAQHQGTDRVCLRAGLVQNRVRVLGKDGCRE